MGEALHVWRQEIYGNSAFSAWFPCELKAAPKKKKCLKLSVRPIYIINNHSSNNHSSSHFDNDNTPLRKFYLQKSKSDSISEN